MPIKLSDSAGNMYVTALDDGLMWAADEGADIFSMSFGIVGASPTDFPSTSADHTISATCRGLLFA